ncbi:hypothetical protein SNK03_004961 [Fusarium graminearum]
MENPKSFAALQTAPDNLFTIKLFTMGRSPWDVVNTQSGSSSNFCRYFDMTMGSIAVPPGLMW